MKKLRHIVGVFCYTLLKINFNNSTKGITKTERTMQIISCGKDKIVKPNKAPAGVEIKHNITNDVMIKDEDGNETYETIEDDKEFEMVSETYELLMEEYEE